MKLNELKLTNPYLSLPQECHDPVTPTPLKGPFLIHANEPFAEELGIDKEELHTGRFVEFVNGSWHPEGSNPFAMCYAGHQFGHYVPQLGDGRAVNIGTLNGWHFQLKGAGVTKYSRSGDGRAVLRSSIREYLMSEAMHGLHIETTRALAMIGSNHSVYRQEWEKGAIVLRLSPSWVRFGTFEYFAHKKHFDELKALTEYAIAESYPYLIGQNDRYIRFFEAVVARTAKLIAKWQAAGFNHGVMNTDNMSIAGLTIDYGPYAFLDVYDHNNICNHSDAYGRYSFGNQPDVAEWNLRALMTALSPLLDIHTMEEILSGYRRLYRTAYLDEMRQKLGLDTAEKGDMVFVKHLLGVLQALQVDYTLFFRTLSRYDGEHRALLSLGLYHAPMQEWLESYDRRLEHNKRSTTERHEKMLQTNPKYVLKNYMLQEAIDAAEKGEYTRIDDLFQIARNPFAEHPKFECWAGHTPEEHRNTKLSCSS